MLVYHTKDIIQFGFRSPLWTQSTVMLHDWGGNTEWGVTGTSEPSLEGLVLDVELK